MEHFTLFCDCSFVSHPPPQESPFKRKRTNIPKLYSKKGPLVLRVNLQTVVPHSFSDRVKENVIFCPLPFLCRSSLKSYNTCDADIPTPHPTAEIKAYRSVAGPRGSHLKCPAQGRPFLINTCGLNVYLSRGSWVSPASAHHSTLCSQL